MSDIDFPDNPITGDTFEDPNGVVWEFDGTQWGNEIYDQATTLNELSDFKEPSPVDGEWIGYKTDTGYWGSKAPEADDYFISLGWENDYPIYQVYDSVLGATPMKPDKIIYEYGMTDSFDIPTYTFWAPVSGFWQISLEITGTSNLGSLNGTYWHVYRNYNKDICLGVLYSQAFSEVKQASIGSLVQVMWMNVGDRIQIGTDDSSGSTAQAATSQIVINHVGW